MIRPRIPTIAVFAALLLAAFYHMYFSRARTKRLHAPRAAETSPVVEAPSDLAIREQVMNDARAAIGRGDTGSAIDILTKALREDPHRNPAMLHLRAVVYGRVNRWEEALADADAGLVIVPGDMTLLNMKALSENRTQRFAEELATAESMIELDPRNPWGYVNRAGARVGLGDRKAALVDIKRAAALDGRFQQAADDAERQ